MSEPLVRHHRYIETPVKLCLACNGPILRKPGQSPASYVARNYCSRKCASVHSHKQSRKATDEEIVAAYKETGNIWKAAKLLGMGGQTIQERLVRIGVARSNRPFTEDEEDRLRREYLLFRDTGNLAALAQSMGRHKTHICTQARRLGLTDQKRGKFWFGKWKYMSEEAARALFEKFRARSMTMGQFCLKYGLDDLGFSRTMQRFFPDEWDAVIESKAPRDTMYRYGRAFEYRTRDHLKSLGFFVMRSPRSGSPIDLVAIRKGGSVLFVQCKRGGQLGVSEWNELFDLALSVDAVPLLAFIPGATGIEYRRLIDRKDGSKRRQPMESFTPAGGQKP